MEADKSSRTAYGTTLFRAIESKRPEGERVCFDPMASDFLELPVRLIAWSRILRQKTLKSFSDRGLESHCGFPVVRTRVIDDLLQDCLNGGIDQLVIIGAGFDSRAYRFKEIPGRVTVFEVDHPATQELKIKKVKRLLGCLPGHVVFVPVDLGNDDLRAHLLEKGYVSTLKTLFICEGLTLYLSADTLDDMLSFIAECSLYGSVIVFDYADASAVDGTNEDEETKRWLEFLKKLGEPPRFGIREGEAGDFLAGRGFKLLANLSGAELEGEYFKKSGRDQEVASFMAIAIAEVVGEAAQSG